MVHLYYGILLINISEEFHLCNIFEIVIEMNRLVVASSRAGEMDKTIKG